MTAQVKEQEALRMKGKLALGGASSGSGRFNAKFMRTLSLQPSGSSGATWQVCPLTQPAYPAHRPLSQCSALQGRASWSTVSLADR